MSLLPDAEERSRPCLDVVDQDDARCGRTGSDLLSIPDFRPARHRGGLDHYLHLMNLPIAIWMSYTYFFEIPAAIRKRAGSTGQACGRNFAPFSSYEFAGSFFYRADPDYFRLERGILGASTLRVLTLRH